MASCDKIETITHSLKITGAKGDLFPGSFVITGANAPVALVESAPMYLFLGIFTAIFV